MNRRELWRQRDETAPLYRAVFVPSGEIMRWVELPTGFSAWVDSEEISYEVWYPAKKTPCGTWLVHAPWKRPRWQRNDAKVKFAWPTKEEALRSLIKRTERYEQLLNLRMAQVQLRLRVLEDLLEKS
jgi:hypothetical protein